MSKPQPEQLTDLLNRAAAGDATAREELAPAVYAVLHETARRLLAQEQQGHTLQATAIVNDAFCQVVDQEDSWQHRGEFYGVAARAMRRLLVDHARLRKTQKRGGDWDRLPLDSAVMWEGSERLDPIELDEALERLQESRPLGSQIVEQRFFLGLTIQEVADSLGVSLRTVEAEWSYARAWLRRALNETE